MFRSGIRIFTLAGIDIQIDPSWFFIFILITWSLTVGVFPAWHPEWPLVFDIAMGIVASLLFFASVLAHEFAHALVAKARGIPIHRIILFLFGGVSNIEREPGSAKTEFLMAIVGPLTSIVLGLFFFSIAAAMTGRIRQETLLQAISGQGPLAALCFWLGSVNILVGIFNLVPGFPLDGGRILRSAIWAATGKLKYATVIASGVGQFVGWLFIFCGIAMTFGFHVPFFGTGALDGIWIAIIGWFLSNAAGGSRVQMLVDDALENVPVSRVMRSDVPPVPSNTTVDDLVTNWFLKNDERAFPVVQEDRLIGLVCLADLKKIRREEWANTSVDAIMTSLNNLTTVQPEDNTAEANHRLMQKDLRQLPVVENGHFLGLLRRRDILRWIQLHSGNLA
jgi:Zn-dependent protease/CBS domain-containing protein